MRLLTLALILSASVAAAQTPQDQPLVQPEHMHYLGSFTTPTNDGTQPAPNGTMNYGGVIGVSEDGQSLFWKCSTVSTFFAKISIPALGGVAKVEKPCTYFRRELIDSDNTPIGGMIEWNGKLYISGYVYYDNGAVATKSLFSYNLDFTNRLGPFALQHYGRLSGQYMGLVAPEWRALFGGPVMGGASSLPIAQGTSSGPAAVVFDPETLGATTAPSKMLIGYQPPHDTFQPYNHADRYAGFAQPSGWASTLYFRRHGENSTYCYGDGDYPVGAPECPDPTDGSKGSHAFPYKHYVTAFKNVDMLAVKNGTKQPWEMVPYAEWQITDLPGSNNGYARLESGAYHHATRKWFISEFSGSGTPRVHVFEIDAPAPPAIADVDCAGNYGEWVPTTEWTACTKVDGVWQESQEGQQLFYVDTPPSGNGLACPASPLSSTATRSCTPAPLSLTCAVLFTGTIIGGTQVSLVQCDVPENTALPALFPFTLTVPRQ